MIPQELDTRGEERGDNPLSAADSIAADGTLGASHAEDGQEPRARA